MFDRRWCFVASQELIAWVSECRAMLIYPRVQGRTVALCKKNVKGSTSLESSRDVPRYIPNDSAPTLLTVDKSRFVVNIANLRNVMQIN